MKTGRLVLLVLSVAAALCGCTEINEYLEIARPERLSKSYIQSLEKWTREEVVYHEFETRIKVVATWKNSLFMESYLSEYAKLYDLTEAEKKKKDILIDAASDYTEFLFYAYVPNREENTFSRADSIWKIYLVDGTGERHEPLDVREVEEITPLITEFYPYVNPYYGKTYNLKFLPKLAREEGDLKLVFTSVRARAEITW